MANSIDFTDAAASLEKAVELVEAVGEPLQQFHDRVADSAQLFTRLNATARDLLLVFTRIRETQNRLAGAAGGGSRPGGNSPTPGGIISAMDRNTAVLTRVVAAMDRNTAAARISSAASAVGAYRVGNVAGAVSEAVAAMPLEAIESAPAGKVPREKNPNRVAGGKKGQKTAQANKKKKLDELALERPREDPTLELPLRPDGGGSSTAGGGAAGGGAEGPGVTFDELMGEYGQPERLHPTTGVPLKMDPKNVRARELAAGKRQRKWMQEVWDTPQPAHDVPPASSVGPAAGAAPAGGNGLPALTDLIGALKANTEATIANTNAIGKGIKVNVAGKIPPAPAGTGVPPPGGKEDPEKGEGNAAKLQATLKNLGQTMQTVFTAGTASILGFTSALSPSAISTFGASIVRVSQEIGKSFVPYVYAAADGLQDFAAWLGTLDEGLKSTVAKVAVWTVGLAGAGALLWKVGTLARDLYKDLRVLGAFMAPTTWTGWGLAIAGVGLAVTGLAAAWKYLAGEAKDAGGAMKDASGVEIPEKNKPVVLKLATLEAAGIPRDLQEKIVGGKPGQAQDLLGEFKKQREAELTRVQQQQAPNLAEESKLRKIIEDEKSKIGDALEKFDPRAERDPGAVAQMLDQERAAAIKRVKERASREGLDISEREFAPYLNATGPMALRGRGGNPEASAEIARLRGQIDKLGGLQDSLGGGGGHLRNVVMPFQSHYSSFDQYQESLQLKALEQDDLNKQNQLETLKQILKETGESNELLKQLNGNAGLLRVLVNVFGGGV